MMLGGGRARGVEIPVSQVDLRCSEFTIPPKIKTNPMWYMNEEVCMANQCTTEARDRKKL
mgnify:CR=1 FL=1|jgi:hypothetical protein